MAEKMDKKYLVVDKDVWKYLKSTNIKKTSQNAKLVLRTYYMSNFIYKPLKPNR